MFSDLVLYIALFILYCFRRHSGLAQFIYLFRTFIHDLDAGCGSESLSKALIDLGVSNQDANSEMLKDAPSKIAAMLQIRKS